MKKYFLGLFFLLLLPAISHAVEKMDGYGKSKWGMTPSQVVSAENGRAHLINPPLNYKGALGAVGIDKVDIGYHDFKVVYQFIDNRLTQVIVQSLENKNSGINKRAFIDVESLLTQKYGHPIFKDEGKKVVWNQPGTTIELTHFLIENVTSMVTVMYIPSSKTAKSTDNL
jgi:hypothetical protein